MGRNYKNLKIYELAYKFLLEIYVSVLPSIPEEEQRNITSQLQRAATSIVLNIVEGCSMRSNKVFFNHLQYSYASAKEVQVLLELCHDLNYLDKEIYPLLYTKSEELNATIYKFMRTVDKEILLRRNNYAL